MLPALKFFQAHGGPLVLVAQGWLQSLFQDSNGPNCHHLPPARSQRVNHDFACPAWMLETPALAPCRQRVAAVCRLLEREGIKPAAYWLDFESGAHLRSRGAEQLQVRAALQEAGRCPRCRKRFEASCFDSLEAYRRTIDEARAYVQRFAFSEPVRSVFPNCHTGNYFVHPILRQPRVAGRYPAYGWQGSGFDVAQPRCYFRPGWHGAGKSAAKMDWNLFLYCLTDFSRCARVLEKDEILVPWVGYLFTQKKSRAVARSGFAIGSGAGYAEMVRHVMLRGAETFAIFAPYDPADDFPEEYARQPRRQLGPFLVSVMDVQRAYREMLHFNDILRAGKVLNFEVRGSYNRLDEHAVLWSGVGTPREALVRTVAFGPERQGTIALFGRSYQLPFRKEGRFFWLYPDGTVAADRRGGAKAAD